MTHIKRWWQRDTPEDRARAVIATCAELVIDQRQRIKAGFKHARLFAGLRPDAFSSFLSVGFADVAPTVELMQDRFGLNVIRSVVNTYVSQLAKEQIKVTWLTDDGTFDQQRLAKTFEQFTEGCFHETRFRRLAPLIALDAAVYGTGAVKVYCDSNRRMRAERVFPFELLVDDLDARYGEPRQLIHHYIADRTVLLAMLKGQPEAIRKAIESAPPARTVKQAGQSKQQADMVEVVESWHLESAEGCGDGRHIIACNDVAICDEEWTLQRFPFAFMRFTPSTGGFWGSGLPELLTVLQRLVNQNLYALMDAIEAATLKVLIERGSKIIKSQVNNRIGDVWEYTGTAPRFEATPPVFQQFTTFLDWVMQQAYAIAGVSQMSAQSMKPAGLDSGRAIRAYADVQTQRLVVDARSYEALHVDAAVLMRDIATEDGGVEVVSPYQGKLRRVKVSSLKGRVANDAVCVPWPTNLLPSTPEGKLQSAIEMSQAGWLPPKKAMRLLDYPDLSAVTTREYASEDYISWVCEQIFGHKRLVAPDPLIDLPGARQAMLDEYARASTMLEPGDERLELARQWIEQAQGLIEQNQPPQPAPGPGPSAPMASPQSAPTSDLLPVGQ